MKNSDKKKHLHEFIFDELCIKSNLFFINTPVILVSDKGTDINFYFNGEDVPDGVINQAKFEFDTDIIFKLLVVGHLKTNISKTGRGDRVILSVSFDENVDLDSIKKVISAVGAFGVELKMLAAVSHAENWFVSYPEKHKTKKLIDQERFRSEQSFTEFARIHRKSPETDDNLNT